MTTEDIAKSTGYDGRLQYLEVLGSCMSSITAAVNDNNPYSLERNLRQAIYMMRAFLKKKQFDDLVEKLNKAKKMIDHGDKRFNRSIDKHLDYVNSYLYDRAAHVLLPISNNDNEEDIDWEKWMAESDL
jgi:hypothetical protein